MERGQHLPGGTGRNRGVEMQPYTPKEKAKITAGAVAAVVMAGMLAVIALAFLMAP
jgi:hypothetical protein